MTPVDYDYLRKLLKERSGLTLSADKQYLVESRLNPVSRKAGLASLGDLVAKLKGGNEDLTVDVVEAMIGPSPASREASSTLCVTTVPCSISFLGSFSPKRTSAFAAK